MTSTRTPLNASDFDAFLSSLGQSPYVRELEEAQSQYSGLRVVDSALARNFRHITRSILNFTDGPPEQLIAALLLRYDLNNLKAIARAKHGGRELDDIRSSLLPRGRTQARRAGEHRLRRRPAGGGASLGDHRSPARLGPLRGRVGQYSSERGPLRIGTQPRQGVLRCALRRARQQPPTPTLSRGTFSAR